LDTSRRRANVELGDVIEDAVADLAYVPEHTVPVKLALYRVQRAAARRGTVRVGALKLTPPGTLAGRFDVSHVAPRRSVEHPRVRLTRRSPP
jgi:hypothetical protein